MERKNSTTREVSLSKETLKAINQGKPSSTIPETIDKDDEEWVVDEKPETQNPNTAQMLTANIRAPNNNNEEEGAINIVI